ncbi:MAG: Cof-type HAD-IIB family hydrolase [Anaerocolumna sp.]
MNKKIIFFDIDGTLIDQRHGLIPSTKEAIRLLKENGHLPVICTGRTRAFLPKELLELGFCGIIAGAGTYVEYQDEVLFNKVEGPDYANDIIDLLKGHKIHYIVEGPEYIYYDKDNKDSKYAEIIDFLKNLDHGHLKELELNDYRMNKITCSLTPESNLDAIIHKLQEKFHLIHHEDGNFEMAPNGYDKSTGIKQMLKYLNIDQEHTYAFGDSTNDIEMLSYVNYGIAMGNSYKEVLESSRYKTTRLEEDGIYKGLKEFGLI